MTIKRRPSYLHIADEKLLEDLRRVARRLNQPRLSQTEYDRRGRYNHQVFARRFGSWGKAVQRAGLRTAVEQGISADDLLGNLLAVWLKLGRRPSVEELHRPLSKYSMRPYLSRFGRWRKAMAVFFEWIRRDDAPGDARGKPPYPPGTIVIAPGRRDVGRRATDHHTARRPGLRQRFRVMLRDHFRCRLCGRSPAMHAGLHLHVDHIVPWSKGGETIDSNLQTLCSDCNQGKCDHA